MVPKKLTTKDSEGLENRQVPEGEAKAHPGS
jgi:hypothetical protein